MVDSRCFWYYTNGRRRVTLELYGRTTGKIGHIVTYTHIYDDSV